MSDNESVLIYGLSTEGYMIASSLVSNSIPTIIIDEKLHIATEITNDIITNYPTATEFIEAESLFRIKPEKDVISNTRIIFFTPKIHNNDNLNQTLSNFSDLSKGIEKDSIIFSCVPVGYERNNELIEILERNSGLDSQKDFVYCYVPLKPRTTRAISVGISRFDQIKIANEHLKNTDIKYSKISDIYLSELKHLEYISSKYSAMISSSESMKYIKDFISRKDLGSSLGDVKYIDDLSDELYDVKCFSSSLDSGEPFLYIMSGISKGIESYSRFFITELKSFMKENQLKASRTEIYLSWDLDKFEIRGNKILFHNALLNKIADLVGNVTELNDYFSQNSKRVISLPLSEKKQLLIICSNQDLHQVNALNAKKRDDIYLLHANTICDRKY